MTLTRLLAAASATLTLLMIVAYLLVIHAQGNQPAVWFVAVLAVAAALAVYGSVAARQRRPALIVAGVLLCASGLLGILSVGLPVIVAGVLAIVAASRGGAVAPVASTPIRRR